MVVDCWLLKASFWCFVVSTCQGSGVHRCLGGQPSIRKSPQRSSWRRSAGGSKRRDLEINFMVNSEFLWFYVIFYVIFADFHWISINRINSFEFPCDIFVLREYLRILLMSQYSCICEGIWRDVGSFIQSWASCKDASRMGEKVQVWNWT